MKKIAIVLAFSFAMFITTHAQIRKVPADVTEAFKAKFPNAKKAEWKDKLTYFEVSFDDNGVATTTDFSSKGEWQLTERGSTYAEAPKAVKEGFSKSKYANADEWKVGETVTKIVKSDNSILYRVYVDKKGGVQKKYLFFNASGQLEKESLTL